MKRYFFVMVIIFACLLYIPTYNHYFFSDDFFNIKVSKLAHLSEFPAFFSFQKNAHSTTFYRPLSTQLFFFSLEKSFGLNPIPYRIVVLLVFALNLWLVYKLSFALTTNHQISLLCLFFYGFTASHFVRIYYLSAFCEILVSVFFLAAAIKWLSYLTHRSGSIKTLISAIIFFILALFSKETAVTFPAIALGIIFITKKTKYLISLIPFIVIDVIYLILRLKVFGGVVGDSYIWEISPKIINTFSWYTAWSLGIPEMFLDFIGPKLHINPNLLLWYPIYSRVIFVTFCSLIIFISVLLIKYFFSRQKRISLLIGSICWFVITLVPVLFLPWHKFPLEQTIAMFGMALLLSLLFTSLKSKALLLLGLTTYLILNITSYLLTYKTNWTISRAKIAQKVISRVTQDYPSLPLQTTIYFQNDSAYIAKNWGASKQIAVALSGSDSFQLIYRHPSLEIYYEDNKKPDENIKVIKYGTKEFLGY